MPAYDLNAEMADTLVEQSPWFPAGHVPGSLAPPVERPMVSVLVAALQPDALRRFQVVLGPRRVGKTTVMYQTVRRLLAAGVPADRVWWIRLDHPLLMEFSLDKLIRLALAVTGDASEANPVYFFLDELVYAKDWDLWLKTFYDERWPVRIVASSSAVAALRRRHADSGVGRWDERYLTPYLLGEYLHLRGSPQRVRPSRGLADTIAAVVESRPDGHGLAEARRSLLLTGGFPELLVRSSQAASEGDRLLESQRVLRADAVERTVYKDIPQAFGVDSPMKLERLLYACAGQITGLLSPTKLSQQLGMTEPTIHNYLAYLERSFLIFTLPNYSGSELASQRRGRRLYFYDAAIRNAALERGLAPLANAVEMGALHENMVAAHLHCLSLTTQTRCFHWREGAHEVDLVYDDPEEPLAFEIATSVRHTRRGLRLFLQRHPRFVGRAWVVSPDSVIRFPDRDTDGIGQLPLDWLLLAASEELQTRLPV